MNDSTIPVVIKLWPSDEPQSEQQELEFLNPGVDNLRFLHNVTVPTLTAFLPDASINTGTAMIVCPGGGLFTLAIDYEGYEVAQWLCERGIAALVLKYRLITTGLNNDDFQVYFSEVLKDIPHLLELTRSYTPTVLADGQQAVNIVRQRAGEWGIKPDRIGMMGFSAGAFVAVITTLHAERQNRPDFAASIYGAMWKDLDVSGTQPPMFIALANDDTLTIKPSIDLYSAWHQANSPVELHIYSQGGHGFGMRKKNPATDAWIERLYEWMQVEGLVKT